MPAGRLVPGSTPQTVRTQQAVPSQPAQPPSPPSPPSQPPSQPRTHLAQGDGSLSHVGVLDEAVVVVHVELNDVVRAHVVEGKLQGGQERQGRGGSAGCKQGGIESLLQSGGGPGSCRAPD